MPNYPDANSITLSVLAGERLSLPMYGAIANGTANDEVAVNDAIQSVADLQGGNRLHAVTGYYRIGAPILVNRSNITIEGDGYATRFFRNPATNMPVGQGMFVIGPNVSNVTLRNFRIDGNTTTTTGLQYGVDFLGINGDDPMADSLTQNTLIWILPGCSNIRIEGMYLEHAGGYVGILDARTGNIEDFALVGSKHKNNRARLFGLSAGDLNYGSWNSGWLLKNDGRAGSTGAVRRAAFLDNTFERHNGTCIWAGHSYGLDVKHESITVRGNKGKAIGRDFVLLGNVDGAVVEGNVGIQVGWTVRTDTDTPIPSYLANNYAVAYDCAGYVSDAKINNNVATRVVGGPIDLDGFKDGQVVGNEISGEPGQICKGIQTGDSNIIGAASSIIIANNTIRNVNAGGIVLKDADGCTVEGNTIECVGGFAIQTAAVQRPVVNCVVRHNFIRYPFDQFPIFEQDLGGGMDPSKPNTFYGNIIDRGATASSKGELFPAAGSGAKTGRSFPSNHPSPTVKTDTYVQTEGEGSSAVWKVYGTNATTTKQYLQVQFANAGLNISDNGAAQTGVLFTGNRTSLGGFSDAIFTGKLMGDGFLALYDGDDGGNTFLDAHANSLNDSWGILHFKGGAWRQSVTTASGARVWIPFGGGSSTPPGSDKWVVYNDAGVYGAETNFQYDKGLNRLTVTGTPGTASFVAASSFFQSSEGLAINGSGGAINFFGASTEAIIQATDTLGIAAFVLRNRVGTNGMVVANQSLDLVDVQMQGSSGTKRQFRMENRFGFSLTGSLPEIQVGNFTSGVDCTAAFSDAAMSILQQRPLRFYSGSNYVGFRAPSTPGNVIWTLPDSDGTAGQFLRTDGAGNLDFVSGSGAVASVTGTANQITASPTTGAVVLSFPSSIYNPVVNASTFAIGTLPGTAVIDSSRNFFGVQGNFTGAVIAAGVISSGGVYTASGTGYYVGFPTPTLVINSSGQFVGGGIAVQSNGVGAGAFLPWNGSAYATPFSGTIDLSTANTIIVLGGVIIGTT